MSMTLSVVCHDCKVMLWIGQHSNRSGWYLYSQDKDVVNRLNLFINAHLDHHLSFVNDGECEYDDPTLEG